MEQSNLMTKGNITKQLFLFSMPLLVGNLFQQLYNTVDSIVVGNFIGNEALAAVGSSNSLINLIIGFFMGIATGAGVVIAQLYGAKNNKRLFTAVHTAAALTLIGGAVLIVLGVILSPVLLRAMQTPEEVMPNSVLYLRIFFLGSLFNLTYNMGAGILRGVGDSKRPLYYLCAACIVNIVLDVLFVVVFKWGIAGVGIATVIAQFVSAVLVVIQLMITKDAYKFNPKFMTVNRRMTKNILHMGIPSGVQSSIISLSNVIVQANINVFGAAAMAGCSAYMKIDGFVIMPVMSFGMAVMTFAGQNYGAKEYERVKSGAKAGMIISLIYTVPVSILLMILGEKMIGVFTTDMESIRCGVIMLKTLAPTYWTLSIVQVLTNMFRGAGSAIAPTLIMVGNMCGIRMIWVNIMAFLTHDLQAVLSGYPVSWITALVCTVLFAWKGNWMKGYKKNSV